MPSYHVECSTPLTTAQKDALALAITEAHATVLSTLKLPVNVTFYDISKSEVYLAGKRRSTNRIRGDLRSGGSRTQQDFDKLAAEIMAAWNNIVVSSPPETTGDQVYDTELKDLTLFGGMIGGLEMGFVIPPSGRDREWLHEHWLDFERKAATGSKEWVDVVKDVKARGLL